jgi:lipid-A-disaccharide synthase
LVAGEDSGDHLGAALMRALKERTAGRIGFAGVGGPQMAAEGLHSLFPIADQAIVGLTAIPARLPAIFRRIRQAADAVVGARPDVLVIIDSPEFTHRVARRVRAAAPGIPIVDYVSPSIWAWRPARAKAMRRYIDHVLALLPFEPAAHMRLGGPPCTYVGHPLSEQVALLRPSPQEASRRSADPPVLLVLPGSRRGEIVRHIDAFGATVAKLAARCGAIKAVLPTLPHLAARVKDATASWPVAPCIIVEPEKKWAAFRIARAALAASGTVTLELAIAAVPTVVAYRVSLFEEIVARLLIQVPTVVLANLVLGENAMPELLQRAAEPEPLAEALAPLLGDTAERRRQLAAFARIDAIMEIGSAQPSAKAADIVLGFVRHGRAPGAFVSSQSLP